MLNDAQCTCLFSAVLGIKFGASHKLARALTLNTSSAPLVLRQTHCVVRASPQLAVLFPPPPKWLGLQTCATVSSVFLRSSFMGDVLLNETDCSYVSPVLYFWRIVGEEFPYPFNSHGNHVRLEVGSFLCHRGRCVVVWPRSHCCYLISRRCTVSSQMLCLWWI